MKKCTYLLTHEFSSDKSITDVIFKSKLKLEELVKIIAYTQFITDDIKHANELNEIDTVLILKAFYDQSIEIIENKVDTDYTIDMYLNWEYHSPIADEILNKEKHHKDGLKYFIKKHIELLDLVIKYSSDSKL